MILSILLGIWLIPALASIVVIITAMIQERSFIPFDDWYDPLLFMFGMLLWPILVTIALIDYRQQRKIKQDEVRQAIEIHYKNKWYE